MDIDFYSQVDTNFNPPPLTQGIEEEKEENLESEEEDKEESECKQDKDEDKDKEEEVDDKDKDKDEDKGKDKEKEDKDKEEGKEEQEEEEDQNQAQVTTMVDPKDDTSRLNKGLLHFLKYVNIGYRSDDMIPLVLVQLELTTFRDIMLDKQEILNDFTQYEAPNGAVFPIMKGSCSKLVLDYFYVHYLFVQHETIKNATNPGKWTKDEFLEWELEVRTGQFNKS